MYIKLANCAKVTAFSYLWVGGLLIPFCLRESKQLSRTMSIDQNIIIITYVFY